jgi:hypothetical protein
LNLLKLFAPNCPLDEEDFEEWVRVNSLAADEVKDAAREAMRSGWVEDADDGLRLTDDHQLGINRGPTDAAVEGHQVPPDFFKLEKSVDRPKRMVGWDVLFK